MLCVLSSCSAIPATKRRGVLVESTIAKAQGPAYFAKVGAGLIEVASRQRAKIKDERSKTKGAKSKAEKE
eukprot:scaffold2660_cov257-Pinguiococcus_pyrenoidosus.AAC.23